MKNKRVLPYNPKLKELARKLRKNGTLSEVLLWRYLRGKQLLGHDFDRQKPIDNFIVDFFCNSLMLAIEIDGDTHNYKGAQDDERQRRLEGLGVSFLRLTDEEVKQNIEGVVAVITDWIREKKNATARQPIPARQPTTARQPTPAPLPPTVGALSKRGLKKKD